MDSTQPRPLATNPETGSWSASSGIAQPGFHIHLPDLRNSGPHGPAPQDREHVDPPTAVEKPESLADTPAQNETSPEVPASRTSASAGAGWRLSPNLVLTGLVVAAVALGAMALRGPGRGRSAPEEAPAWLGDDADKSVAEIEIETGAPSEQLEIDLPQQLSLGGQSDPPKEENVAGGKEKKRTVDQSASVGSGGDVDNSAPNAGNAAIAASSSAAESTATPQYPRTTTPEAIRLSRLPVVPAQPQGAKFQGTIEAPTYRAHHDRNGSSLH